MLRLRSPRRRTQSAIDSGWLLRQRDKGRTPDTTACWDKPCYWTSIWTQHLRGPPYSARRLSTENARYPAACQQRYECAVCLFDLPRTLSALFLLTKSECAAGKGHYGEVVRAWRRCAAWNPSAKFCIQFAKPNQMVTRSDVKVQLQRPRGCMLA